MQGAIRKEKYAGLKRRRYKCVSLTELRADAYAARNEPAQTQNRKHSGGAGRVVIPRLGGIRISGKEGEGIPRSDIPGGILRHYRDQYEFLQSDSCGPCQGLDRESCGEYEFHVHRKTVAAIYA